jgi:peptidoglycan lytic transglycosylase D
MRLLLLCPLVGLAACASQLPPVPTAVPVSAQVNDSLVPVVDLSALTNQSSAADASVLNDLAEATPDPSMVPAFDAGAVQWDIDVHTYASHPRVRYYLDYFQGPARSRMEIFLSRSARFEPMIRARFLAEGLPGDLGYLALIESGYSSEAVSRSYAVGMWQFMRGTGKGYGLRVDSWVDERRDPVKATDAAARHLRDLRARFGSLYLAAAAYNAGAGKVSRSLGKLAWDAPAGAAPDPVADSAAADAATDASEAIDASDVVEEAEDTADESEPTLAEADAEPALELVSESEADPAPDAAGITSDAAFFRLASTDLLAAETQDYVPKLIAAALIAKAPAQYGFATPAAAPFAYDSLVVRDATGLDVVAMLAGVSVAEVRELNPQYLRLVTPPRATMVIRLPAGSGPTVAERYAAMSPAARVHYLTYVTRRQEKLGAVAARYHLPMREIQRANPALKGTRPASGTRLVIPVAAVPSALAMKATGTLGGGRAMRSGGTLHRVRRGETLSGIARKYRVTVRSLRRVNALPSDHALRAGMRIRIPG